MLTRQSWNMNIFIGISILCCFLISGSPVFATEEAGSGNIISTKESNNSNLFDNIYLFDSISYNYSHGWDLTIEFAATDKIKGMKNLAFRLGLYDGSALYGIDYVYHDVKFGNDPYWYYRGISFMTNKDIQYIGVPIGLMSNWGGFIETVPYIHRNGSMILLRCGVRTDGRVLEFMWRLMGAIVSLGTYR